MEKFTKQDCVVLLQEKQKQLYRSGENRFPRRTDFSDREVVGIKAFLGPWPRALEAAGLKPCAAGKGKICDRNSAKSSRSNTGNSEKKR